MIRGVGGQKAAIVILVWAGLVCGAWAPVAVASTASVDSAQAIAWLNAQRAANGIPAGITDNPEWDLGCKLHIAWWAKNPNASNPHIETPGSPGYSTQGAFAGANAVLAEGVDWAPSREYPWGAADPWEQAPIHLMQLLGAELSVSGFAPTCMITWPGYQRTPPPTPQLLSYPGNGTSFIYTSEQAEEWPFTPAPFVGLPQGGTTGPYLYVLGWGTGHGQLTGASLSGPSGPLEVRTVDNETTGSKGDLGAYLPPGGIMIPVKPLLADTTYTASATFAPSPTVVETVLPAAGELLLPEISVTTSTGPGSVISPGESATAPAPLSITWSFKTAPARDQLRLWPALILSDGRVLLRGESSATNVSVALRGPHGRLVRAGVHRRGRVFRAAAMLTAGRWRACARSGGGASAYGPASSCIELHVR